MNSFRQGDVAIENLLDISLGHKRLEHLTERIGAVEATLEKSRHLDLKLAANAWSLGLFQATISHELTVVPQTWASDHLHSRGVGHQGTEFQQFKVAFASVGRFNCSVMVLD